MDDEAQEDLAIRLFKQAYRHQMNKELDEAVELYEKSIEAYPTAEAHTFLGWTYSWMGRIDDAIAECQKAIEVDPKNADAHYQLGIAYFGSPDTVSSAIPALEKYLELQPNGPNAEAAKQLIATAKASSPGSKKD